MDTVYLQLLPVDEISRYTIYSIAYIFISNVLTIMEISLSVTNIAKHW